MFDVSCKALHPEVLHLGPSKDLIAAIGRTYPGRASSAPILDVFVTLLSLGPSSRIERSLLSLCRMCCKTVIRELMHIFSTPAGASGYKKLLQARKDNFEYLKERLGTYPRLSHLCLGVELVAVVAYLSRTFTLVHKVTLSAAVGDVAVAHGERILTTKSNMISIGMSLSTIAAKAAERGQDIVFLGWLSALVVFLEDPFRTAALKIPNVTQPFAPCYWAGSMLFSRNVSGTRVLVPTVRKTISGVEFEGYGTHIDSYPGVYLTAAAAVGMERYKSLLLIW